MSPTIQLQQWGSFLFSRLLIHTLAESFYAYPQGSLYVLPGALESLRSRYNRILIDCILRVNTITDSLVVNVFEAVVIHIHL